MSTVGRRRTGTGVLVLLAVLGAVLLVVGVRLASAAPTAEVADAGDLPVVPRVISTAAPTSTATPTAAPTPAAAPVPALAAPPVRLTLPAAGVDAVVVPVGVERSGQLQLPGDSRRVGWWTGGAAPGDPSGTVLLGGHVDTVAYGPGALAALHDLHVGDVVVLAQADGTPHRYTVQARRSYPKTSLPVDLLTARDAGPRLVMVTCGGEFDASTGHYLDNVVVVAVPA